MNPHKIATPPDLALIGDQLLRCANGDDHVAAVGALLGRKAVRDGGKPGPREGADAGGHQTPRRLAKVEHLEVEELAPDVKVLSDLLCVLRNDHGALGTGKEGEREGGCVSVCGECVLVCV